MAVAVLEPIAAAVGLALCLALLLHMALPPRQRQRVDTALRRAWHAGRRRLRRSGRDGNPGAQAAQAAEQASEVIRRARRAAQQDGNVIRPDAFNQPRKPH
ncbi:MAG TPA: hypothetical protein PLB41_07270 [Rubrivivax sp.]|nr:hypothetical protein [Rubrivivax sp.]HPO21192.1 hypothetical protein [Rubrivivax sp.]